MSFRQRRAKDPDDTERTFSEEGGGAEQSSETTVRQATSSMMLLQTILDSALDPGYRAAAKSPSEKLRWWRALLIGLLVLLLGVGTGLSIRALRTESSIETPTRAFLMREIGVKRNMTDTLKEQIDELEGSVTSAESELPKAPALPPKITLASSETPVSGPGVTIEIRDGSALVSDNNIRTVVNLLWQAGAEAISVNNVRLGPGTTIRTAGSAIFVDLDAISEPYEVVAVGNSQMLYQLLSKGDGGAALRTYAEKSEIEISVSEEDGLLLPAARVARPQFAQSTKGGE